MSQEPWAELGETVGAIRAELQRAMQEGQNEPLKFRTGPVELEFTLAVRKEIGARTKVFVLPWTGEAHGVANVDRTHRIKFTLQPVDADGEDAQISSSVDELPE
ncbi:trypco2 family protein [Streptomyces sp. RPT161]|uniref:trypco2 family protein n=1 Tax=Streptomyces sp. RPT161 TaxID=3015993 RepID=UPI0022B8C3AA|nr:trypco2 family protein [Streptomyces sp. RPT161]